MLAALIASDAPTQTAWHLAGAARHGAGAGEVRAVRRMAVEAATFAAPGAAAPRDLPAPAHAAGSGGVPSRTALRLAELAIERYLAAAEAAKDEAALLKAQSLAERAIARATRLEELLR